MRRREKHSDGGGDGEQGEDDEAEAIQHHSSELPVVFYLQQDVSLVPEITNSLT